MKYWPLSLIAESPLLPPAYFMEVTDAGRTCNMSRGAFLACGDVAMRTAPVDAPNMVVMESPGAPARRVYVRFPECEEWLRLERGGVVAGDDGLLHVLIDALH